MKKRPNFDLTVFKNSYGIYVGLIAIVAFFIIRPNISVNAGRTLASNPKTLETKVKSWTSDVIPEDSIRVLTYYSYNLDDSLAPEYLETFWSAYSLYDSTRISGLGLSEETKELNEIAYEHWIIGIDNSVLGYSINPVFGKGRITGSDSTLEGAVSKAISALYSKVDQTIDISDLRENDAESSHQYNIIAKVGAQQLELSISGSFELVDDRYIFFLQKIEPLRMSKDVETSAEVKSIIIWLITSIVTMLIIMVVGYYRRGKEGAIDWKRIGIAMITFFLLYVSWRLLIFFPKANGSVSEYFLAFFLVETLNGLGFSIYLTIAYGVWESMNRMQDRPLQRMIDSIWAFRWFRKEVGEAIIHIPLIAGVVLLVFAASLQIFDTRFFQSTMNFVAPELLSLMPAISLPISALLSTVIVGAVSLGLTLNVVRDFNISTRTAVLIATPIASITLIMLPRFYATEASFTQDFVMHLVWVATLYLFWIRFGGLSALLSLSFFISTVQVLPFIESSDLFYQVNGWSIILGWLLFLIFGFVAYKFAPEIHGDEEYSPEYEEKLLNQMRISNEIQIAAESQFDLMPHNTPSYPKADIAGFFVPSFEVGGDFYDYLIRDNPDGTQDLCFTIADVSGKGMKAAMQAVYASGLINSRMKTDDPAQTLRNVSSVLKDKTDKRTFVTAICATFSAYNDMLAFSNAGHCLPVIKRGDTVRFIESEGPKFALVIKKEVDYENRKLSVQDQDVIIFYSDGLNEAANKEGTRYDYKRVFDLLKSIDTVEKSASQIAKIIKEDVQAFSNFQMVDDTTLICLKITK